MPHETKKKKQNRQVGSRLCSKIIKLNRGDTRVDALDDLSSSKRNALERSTRLHGMFSPEEFGDGNWGQTRGEERTPPSATIATKETHLLSNFNGVNVSHIEAITELCNARRNLVKSNSLSAPVFVIVVFAE